MNKLILIALLGMSSHAWATGSGNNDCNGNGSCGDTITNNTTTSNTTNAPVGLGGNGYGAAESVAKAGANAESNAVGVAGAEAGVVGSGNGSAKVGPVTNKIDNTTTVQGDKVEAPNIPVGSSIAISGNATAECTIHKQKSFNAFFVSTAWGGHEVEPVCMAKALGRVDVANQIMCNTNDAFKKAFNQLAEVNQTAACVE